MGKIYDKDICELRVDCFGQEEYGNTAVNVGRDEKCLQYLVWKSLRKNSTEIGSLVMDDFNA